MIFSTPAFLFLFLPPVLLLSLLIGRRAQNVFLLLASLLFYAWGDGAFVLLLMGSALLNHLFGLGIGAAAAPRRRRFLLAAGVGFNVVLLAAGKYAAFIMSGLGPLLGAPEAGRSISWHQPLGISFFTFMAIAYLVEVYNRAVPAERNPVHTALYISFFPTVLAGPINRFSSLGRQLAERQASPELLAQGARRFIIGLGKKVLLADTLARAVDAVFAVPAADLTTPLAWMGAVGYTLQIFLDFAGYSDMAIGLGRMFGFTFMENFNYPYVSRSISEFWTRWHISLSTWLRDFLFLPMAYAFSRRFKADRWLGIRADSWCYYPAMLLTMTLCGLWHGAAWTFIAWGLYHGLFIVLERQALKKRLKALWPALQVAYSLLVVAFGWVLFRATDFSQAATFWRSMLGFAPGSGREFHASLFLDGQLLCAAGVGLIAAVPIIPALQAWAMHRLAGERHAWLRQGWSLLEAVSLAVVLAASAMTLAAATFNPFIYARF